MRQVKQFFRANYPQAYGFCRKLWLNAYNQLLWSAGRHMHVGTVKEADPYDANFWGQQERYDYDTFARVLLTCIQPSSVLDVGCGNGNLLSALARAGVKLDLLGLDNSPMALSTARQRDLQVEQFDITATSSCQLLKLASRLGTFDLTVCLEVAEHVPVWHACKLLKLLTITSATVVFSAAQPGQGGVLHVNEQPPTYWIRKFFCLDFHLDMPTTTALRRMISPANLPFWYKNNLLVFRKARLERITEAG